MKPKKMMVVQVPAYAARRLYYQGHKICTSIDGYTTQEQVQQLTNPVSDAFFSKDCVYGFVVPEQESEPIRKFQKQGLINILVAGLSGIFCIHFLMAYMLFKNNWYLGGFLAISYFSVYYWVKTFEAIRPNNNPYLQMMAKYGLSINKDEE